MVYCYHCTTRLSKDYKVCPHCNKNLDVDLLKRIYQTGNAAKRGARIKIWFRERNHTLVPFFTLLIGIGLGVAIWWSYAQLQIATSRSNAQMEILGLKAKVADLQGQMTVDSTQFTVQLADKDSVVYLLAAQKATMRKLINLTRRLSNKANIAPSSAAEADYFRRNMKYQITVFDKQEESLAALGYGSPKTYNLMTIPQLLTEQAQPEQTAKASPE